MTAPHNYDTEATELRVKLKAKGIVLVVAEGELGSGISIQASQDTLRMIPFLLRKIADKLTLDIQKYDARNSTPGAEPAASPG